MRSGAAIWEKWILPAMMLAVIFGWSIVWAAETGKSSMPVEGTMLSSWITYIKTHYTRATWDDLMRWVNFFILAWLVYKYARTPMANFLQGKKAETARAIGRMEEKKREAQAKILDGQQQLRDSSERLDRIKERIVVEGKRRKEKMIADAKRESRLMLDASQVRIENQIRNAHQIIRVELIEMATEKALVKLPQIMTEKDHDRMMGLWMEEASR